MKKKILITGGGGFVGSHLTDELLNHGYNVRIFDNLCPQVHGISSISHEVLFSNAEFYRGDIRDADALRKALSNIDVVFHFAAAVGVGQSMYEIEHYTDVNMRGTFILLQALEEKQIERLIVASSMSVYGEGLYQNAQGDVVEIKERSLSHLKTKQWDPCEENGMALKPLPTPETKAPSIPSIYAISKYAQERMCMVFGRAYGIPTVALRFFNIYGPRQALSNPYTGVLAIFASRLLNHRVPVINEDGLQRRDFVNVHDVAQACRLALEVPEAAGHVFNVGSGQSYTVLEIANLMSSILGCEKIDPEITEKFRMGDIRHCFADISLIKEVLGYKPMITLNKGLEELAQWLEEQAAEDDVEEAVHELALRGLTV